MKKIDKAWFMFGLKFRDHLEEQEYTSIKTPFTISFFTVSFYWICLFIPQFLMISKSNLNVGSHHYCNWYSDPLCGSLFYEKQNPTELYHCWADPNSVDLSDDSKAPGKIY